MARQLSQQFHATLQPSWTWSADAGEYSADIAITDPSNPDSVVGGRISWSNSGDANFFSNSGDVYGIEGVHKTPSAAVSAFKRQHMPNSRIVKKFKDSEVQPLAEQIQAAGGFDGWKAMVDASSTMLGGKIRQ